MNVNPSPAGVRDATTASVGHPMDGFRLGPSDFTYVGSNLRRPECVLTTSCGDLYVSDKRGGVTRISPDGSETLYQLYELGKPASRGDAHPQVVPGVTEPAGTL